ncbi:MAG: phosphohydrolase, partial [Eubacterium sp.]
YNDAHSTQEKVFCSIASDLCRYHHERWDGTGGLYHYKGDDISIIARAGAVANAWDHLIQDESNGETRHLFQKIEDGAGTLFDPEMVKALKICLF